MHLFGQRGSGRVTRNILIYIEVAVKMRDARPFDIDIFVDNYFFSIVFYVKFMPDRVEKVGGKGFALLGFFINDFLKFGKQGLPVKRLPGLPPGTG